MNECILSLKFQRNFNDQTFACASFANNLASSNCWNLYWIMRLGGMWLYYWYEITGQITKCLSDVLMSFQCEIEFCYCGSKIRGLVRDLQQNPPSFSGIINVCRINLLMSSYLIMPSLFSKSQHAQGTRLCINLEFENWIAVAKLRLH